MKIAIKSLALLLTIITSHGNVEHAHKLNIVATNSIIGNWVKEIANNNANLTILVGADTDNHTFEANPRDGVILSKADIIFENGLGLEFWLNGLYQSSNSKAIRVPLSNHIKSLLKNECHGLLPCNHGHHHHSEYDPHTWLSVDNVLIMVQTITDILAAQDPANANSYKENNSRYIDALKKLDAWIFEQIQQIPLPNRKLVTNHDSLAYFANRYGFKIIADVLGSTTTENVEPSASQFANLVKIIRKNKVPAIFGENTQTPVLVNILAKEAHLPQPKLLYIEALSKENGPAKNYIQLMQYNVDVLVESLK